jgi:N-acyl-D-aspartate/D-glutamate deacylase
LDLALIRDEATPLDPHRYPSGIEHVLVNGVFVVDGGELTRALPGRVITPADKGGRPISD